MLFWHLEAVYHWHIVPWQMHNNLKYLILMDFACMPFVLFLCEQHLNGCRWSQVNIVSGHGLLPISLRIKFKGYT